MQTFDESAETGTHARAIRAPVIVVAAPGAEVRAMALSRAFGIEAARPDTSDDTGPMDAANMAPAVQPVELHVTLDRVELRRHGARRGISVEIAELRRRLAQGRRLALARAVGARPRLHVLDGMAGFGLDGLTLAALGCAVTLVERNPVMAALLADARDRTRRLISAPGSAEVRVDDVLRTLSSRELWDVVYLDPMFPERSKRTLPKQRMQLLRELADPPPADDELARLVDVARTCARERVVVKRRLKDAALALSAPDWRILGRSLRFDVYRGVIAGGPRR
jgi:16S rRNA (guanine1516-N2)-methyltransferase